MVSKLLEYVPEHTYYCEVFGGGAALLFAKEPAKFEVYNDIDSGLVNFFRVLRDPEQFEQFYRKVCLTPYSREEYYYCRDTWRECEDVVERAYRWFIAARMAFSGQFKSGNWSHTVKQIRRSMSGAVSRYLSTVELLPELHRRLMCVQVEHLDWKACAEKYNAWEWDGFMYMDPPYHPAARRSGGYVHDFTEEQHEELVDWLLSRAKTKVMLSGYANPLYERLEQQGWRKVCWDVACHAAAKTRKTQILGEGATFRRDQRRNECIWANY